MSLRNGGNGGNRDSDPYFPDYIEEEIPAREAPIACRYVDGALCYPGCTARRIFAAARKLGLPETADLRERCAQYPPSPDRR